MIYEEHIENPYCRVRFKRIKITLMFNPSSYYWFNCTLKVKGNYYYFHDTSTFKGLIDSVTAFLIENKLLKSNRIYKKFIKKVYKYAIKSKVTY